MIEKLDVTNPETTLFTAADAIAWNKINELIEDVNFHSKMIEDLTVRANKLEKTINIIGDVLERQLGINSQVINRLNN